MIDEPIDRGVTYEETKAAIRGRKKAAAKQRGARAASASRRISLRKKRPAMILARQLKDSRQKRLEEPQNRAAAKPATATKSNKSFAFEDKRATPKPATAAKKSFAFEDKRATPKPATTKKKVAAKPSFRSAYAAARKKYGAGTGGDTFTWNGKKYSVASKEDLEKGLAKKTKRGIVMTKKKAAPRPRPKPKANRSKSFAFEDRRAARKS